MNSGKLFHPGSGGSAPSRDTLDRGLDEAGIRNDLFGDRNYVGMIKDHCAGHRVTTDGLDREYNVPNPGGRRGYAFAKGERGRRRHFCVRLKYLRSGGA